MKQKFNSVWDAVLGIMDSEIGTIIYWLGVIAALMVIASYY